MSTSIVFMDSMDSSIDSLGVELAVFDNESLADNVVANDVTARPASSQVSPRDVSTSPLVPLEQHTTIETNDDQGVEIRGGASNISSPENLVQLLSSCINIYFHYAGFIFLVSTVCLMLIGYLKPTFHPTCRRQVSYLLYLGQAAAFIYGVISWARFQASSLFLAETIIS